MKEGNNHMDGLLLYNEKDNGTENRQGSGYPNSCLFIGYFNRIRVIRLLGETAY
jgi:hypothetical protein